MPSVPTHAFAAVALGSLLGPAARRRALIALGAFLSVLPDADVVGFRLGIPYAHTFGHRGFSHSLLFAATAAALAGWAFARRAGPDVALGPVALFLFLGAAAASHGLLDALTDGGLGVAFFSPFSNRRYFFPWRPIVVSPISLRRFFSGRGRAVVTSELVTVWLPGAALIAAATWARARRRRRHSM
jgi:inner membrane protein